MFKPFSFLFLSHFGHIRICFSPQFCLIACFKYFVIKKWLLKVSLLLSRLWYLSSYFALFLIMFSLESLVCYDLNEYVYLVSRDYTTLMEHIKKDWTCNFVYLAQWDDKLPYFWKLFIRHHNLYFYVFSIVHFLSFGV